MVRFHPLPLLRDGAEPGVLRGWSAVAPHHAGRVRDRLFDAAARCRRIRAYRRQGWTAAYVAAVGGNDDGSDAADGPIADAQPDRRCRRLAADPAAVRDGVLGGRRI